jgi:LmbE family N-acetylglucosaminyl deacetylase
LGNLEISLESAIVLKLTFNTPSTQPHRVLCLGAHSDDIEIGCGGTIMRLIENIKELSFYWVVFSANEEREKEALTSAQNFLENAKEKTILIKNFRESYFPFVGVEIKEHFEQMKKEFSPDLIFSHYRHDLHQDHRLISDLTWNTYRNNLILEYEIPKFDGDFGSPNFFVHLNEALCQKKINNIQDNFVSQHDKPWFTDDTFLSILRLRGVESNAPNKYAEAFYCRKLIY